MHEMLAKAWAKVVAALRDALLFSRGGSVRYRNDGPSPAGRRGKEVRIRLAAGGEWIRTFSSARDRQHFRGFVRVGADRRSARRSLSLRARGNRLDEEAVCRAAGGARWGRVGSD